MAITVAQIAASCQQHMPDFPALVSNGQAIDLINRAHTDAMEKCRIYTDQFIDVGVTSGTGEYALASTVLRVWNAAWFTAAGSVPTPLFQTSIDRLDSQNPSWRSQTGGNPYQYYTDGSMVGLFLTPSVTSGSAAPGYTVGFPFVRLYVSQATTLGTGDSLPAIVQYDDFWVYSTLRRFATMLHRERIQEFAVLEQLALDRLQMMLEGRLPRDPIKILTKKPQMMRL